MLNIKLITDYLLLLPITYCVSTNAVWHGHPCSVIHLMKGE